MGKTLTVCFMNTCDHYFIYHATVFFSFWNYSIDKNRVMITSICNICDIEWISWTYWPKKHEKNRFAKVFFKNSIFIFYLLVLNFKNYEKGKNERTMPFYERLKMMMMKHTSKCNWNTHFLSLLSTWTSHFVNHMLNTMKEYTEFKKI